MVLDSIHKRTFVGGAVFLRVLRARSEGETVQRTPHAGHQWKGRSAACFRYGKMDAAEEEAVSNGQSAVRVGGGVFHEKIKTFGKKRI